MRALLVLVLLLAGNAWAQDWNAIVAAARKEGSLTIGVPSNASHREFIQTNWQKAHPEIKLSQTIVAGGKFVQQVVVERKAGKNLWDLAITGAVVCFQMKDAGLVDPLRDELLLPEVRDAKTWGGWESAFLDRDGRYVLATRSFLKMPFYNAKLLAPEKVKADGKRVLLSPELRKKIIWHDPTIPGSGESFAPVIRRLLGDEGFKTFLTEQVVFASSGAEVVEKTVRGQFAIALGPVLTGDLDQYTKAGLQVDIRPLGNVPEFGAYGNTGGSNMIVIKDRPHPNATRVFVNWFLSRDVQAALAKSQLEDTRRTDVPSVAPVPERRAAGVSYFDPQREENLAELRSALDFVRQNRNK
jgi:ABC-type Fe3+ transport system substrate-binding protein